MPVFQCPIEDCGYETPDIEPTVAAALLSIHASVHCTPGGPAQAARIEKVKRPEIKSSGTTEDWQYFRTRWSDYVRATRVRGPNIVMQLLECCDDQLRKDLTRNAGGTLADKAEEEVFEAMKRLAVREENPMVARVALHNMKQDRDEPIRAYGARLRGQAGVCKYTLPCPGCSHNVHYTEAILRDVLCRGLADNEIQMDLLSDSNQDMTLEQVLRFVEAKEAGKRSAAQLLIPQAADHIAGSSYKRQKGPPPRSQQGPDRDSCTYCGTKVHGKNTPTKVRRSECPAFGTRCNHCGRDHHYERVCRVKHNWKQPGTEQENGVFDTVCDITSTINTKVDTLDHHVYSKITRNWSRRQSKPQPFVRLQMCTTKEDYDHFGYPLRSAHGQTTVYAMVDTGCQSCLAGSNIVRKLGLLPLPVP